MKMAVGSSVALGALVAMPMLAFASGPFDINTLPTDEENRYSNVGAFIIAVVDEDGNVVGGRSHCSGVLIHESVFLTAGHCTGPGEFPKPSFLALFVSLAADALDQTTWIRVAKEGTDAGSGMIKWRVVTHPSIPPCPGPPGCDPTTLDIFKAGDPGIADHGLVFLEEPVRDIAPAKLADPGTLETPKAAQTPMTIVGYPLPTPFADESEWDGLRRFRTSSLDTRLDEDWATWSLPSNVCFGDSGGPIFLNTHPAGGKKHDRLVANVSDGGIDCLSANTNARLDTPPVQKWIRETIKSVLGDDTGEE
jgi:V8-like Glu-specific endopeptidase